MGRSKELFMEMRTNINKNELCPCCGQLVTKTNNEKKKPITKIRFDDNELIKFIEERKDYGERYFFTTTFVIEKNDFGNREIRIWELNDIF